MRRAVLLMAVCGLVTTSCTDSADETADGVIALDTASIVDADTVGTGGGGSPAGPAASSPDGTRAPGGRPDSGDAAGDPVDDPADDPADEPGGDVAASIPSRFHGEWNADLAACGTGSSETRLRISADRIRFYESVGAVREVDIVSDRVIAVTAEYQGEGDTWQDERRLSLSADGNSLTVSNGTELVRYRCP